VTTPSAESKATVLDTLIQSATVALFHSCGVAAAPVAPRVMPVEDVVFDYPVGFATVEAQCLSGVLFLSLPVEVHGQVQRTHPKPVDPRDLVRELVNQLVGRLKNRLVQYQATLRATLPGCLTREEDRARLQAQGRAMNLYRFRTIRGDVVVAVQGHIDASRLVYSGTSSVNAEGDVILF
jgi:hypothetical protein